MDANAKPLVDYLAEVWRTRYFWLSLVRRDVESRYRRSVLGVLWSLLHPLALTVMITIVFHSLLEQDVKTFVPFLLAGIATWGFLSACVISGCGCFVQAEAYIRQHPAPLAIYPLRNMLAASFHFAIALLVVAGLVAVAGSRAPTWACLALAPACLLLAATGWALAALFGLAHARFPDTQHLAEVGMQVLFYATPVIYPASLLARNRFGWLLAYNPVAPFLELVRAPLVEGRWPAANAWLVTLAVAVVAVTAAAAALARNQRRLALYL